MCVYLCVVEGGVFPQSHLPITTATQLNGAPRHPGRLGEDHFLDKMLDARKPLCNIFRTPVYILLRKPAPAKRKSTQPALIIIRFLSLDTSPRVSLG